MKYHCSLAVTVLWALVPIVAGQQGSPTSSSPESSSSRPAATIAPSPCSASSIYGVLQISNQSDADSIASCPTVYGNLALATGLTTPISIDGVEAIEGNLWVQSESSSFSANDLRSVSKAIVVTIPNGTADFPQLRVIGQLYLSDVASVHMPLLEAVNGTSDTPGTQAREPGSFVLNDLPSTAISSNNLKNITSPVSILNNAALSNLSMPQLTTIGADAWVYNNINLNVVQFDALTSVGSDLDITGNVTDVVLPSLQDLGSFKLESISNVDDLCDRLDVQIRPLSNGDFSCKTVSSIRSGSTRNWDTNTMTTIMLLVGASYVWAL